MVCAGGVTEKAEPRSQRCADKPDRSVALHVRKRKKGVGVLLANQGPVGSRGGDPRCALKSS
jgi:hypothetical protein